MKHNHSLPKAEICKSSDLPSVSLYSPISDIEVDSHQAQEMSCRYVNTHREVSVYPYVVSLHSHSYGELIYCREADNVEYLIGSDRYRIKTGDVIFISPGISHRPIILENAKVPFTRDVIWLSPDYMSHLHEIFGSDLYIPQGYSVPLRTVGGKWRSVGDLFTRGVLEEENRQANWETVVAGNTLIILSYLLRYYAEYSGDIVPAEKPDLLDHITSYIEENYENHISATELSQKFYVSSSTISHLFKKKMGISVYRYITQRRLIAAKSRIEAGEGLENIALAVGFSDYSGFYRAFRQEYGISPRQYRKLQTQH